MNKSMRGLIMLIGHEITGSEPDKELINSLSADEQKELFDMAAEHSVIQMAADAILKNELSVDSGLKAEYRRYMLEILYSSSMQDRTLKELGNFFDHEGIPYIPLKGSVLKHYYPESWMRTSGDIDILVRDDDLAKAGMLVKEKLSYRETDRTSHDVVYVSPEDIHLEIHHRLIDSRDYCGDFLTDINPWDHAGRSAAGFRYDFTDEFFYMYSVAHMVKHFLTGGCGLRFFADLKVLNDRMSPEVRYSTLMKEAGLEEFLQTAERLAEVWFEGAEHDELSLRLEDRVLEGGLFVDMKKRTTVNRLKKGGSGATLKSRVWLSKNDLQGKYPQLKEKPAMAPLYQVKRWFNLFNRDKMNSSLREARETAGVTEEELKKEKKLLDDLGIMNL